MAVSLHTTKTYKVEYGVNAIDGWDEIENFIKFLREKQRDNVKGIWIDDNEDYVEIDFKTLKVLMEDEVWGEVATHIYEESDKSNTYARLEIW